MASSPGPTSYDLVPYESHPFVQTHPDRLATVAILLGLKPRPVDRCRVLEIGCAGGGNLVPMALGLPKSTFLGIDLSARQIQGGQQMVGELGLKNIELKHLSILDVGPEFGLFDYIICHGVYSWVPAEVQDKILEICKKNLSPAGVAYVSYNTYPGWHMRGMIRDMMRFHTTHSTEPMYRTRQARNLLDFLAKSVAGENSPYSHLLRSEVDSLRQSADSYLFHEHLEEVNEPIYFHQFAERAAGKGLRYLGEVNIGVMLPGNLPPEVASVLHMLSSDMVHMEQYMDFLRNRMFRQTLLCHQNIVPNYSLRPERLQNLYVAAAIRPVAEKPNLASTDEEHFQGRDGVAVKTGEPLIKTALAYLGEVWPTAVRFSALLATARERLKLPPEPDKARHDEDVQKLGQCILGGYTSSGRLVELFTQPPQFTMEVKDRPIASPLARVQAKANGHVTNLRHETVGLGDFERQVLLKLDGQHDKPALCEAIRDMVTAGDLNVEQDGQPVSDQTKLVEVLTSAIDKQLTHFARSGLLVG